MIIEKNKALLDKIKILLRENDNNIAIGNLLFNVYTEMYPEDIKRVQRYISMGEEEKSAVVSSIFDYLEMNDDEEGTSFVAPYLFNGLEKLDFDYYANNECAKSITNIGKYKDCSLEYLSYAPYQTFAADDIYLTGYKENNHIGYFDQEFKYLALLKNKEIWMSLNPNEIKTMEPYIAKAKGQVLVLGLGMGYVAFMMAMKKEVKSVTIIEKDQNVINIFNNLIWPNFKNKDKIQIINDDAIGYLRRKHNIYDYIFADLWHSPDDGLPLFIEIKKIDKKIDCWLETSMYALLRRCMFTLLDEQLHGLKDNNYLKAKTYTDKVINKFYFQTKNLHLINEDDLNNLLDFNNLLNLVIGL